MNEAWDKIFAEKGFDLSKDLHYVTATEIKSITGGGEARLLTKFDFSKDVPAILKNNGYFLLPVKNGTYAIVRGAGFQKLAGSVDVVEYKSNIDFPLTTAGRGQSEMQFLDNAYNTGVLEQILGEGSLYQSIRGRERSHKFSFKVGKNEITVEGVQIEVDSGLEGRNSIILVEAKIGVPHDFIIRQLFYPYRRFKDLSRKKTIPVFLTYDLKTAVYNAWIYEFFDDGDYNAIRLVKTHTFRIVADDPIALSAIKPAGIVLYTQEIPQADKLDRVIEFTFKVSEGFNNSKLIAAHFDFDVRQSSYYRQAAEALGLVVLTADKTYALTEIGKQFVLQNTEDRIIFISQVLADFPLAKACLEAIASGKKLTKTDVILLVQDKSTLTGETVRRRAQTLWAWLKWIAEHTGTFALQDDYFVLN